MGIMERDGVIADKLVHDMERKIGEAEKKACNMVEKEERIGKERYAELVWVYFNPQLVLGFQRGTSVLL